MQLLHLQKSLSDFEQKNKRSANLASSLVADITVDEQALVAAKAAANRKKFSLPTLDNVQNNTEAKKRILGHEIIDAWMTVKPTANNHEVTELIKLIHNTHHMKLLPSQIKVYMRNRQKFQPTKRHDLLPAAAVELWTEYYKSHGNKPNYKDKQLVELLLIPLANASDQVRDDPQRNKEALQSWFRYQTRRERRRAKKAKARGVESSSHHHVTHVN
jgi:hypothetical protein